MKIGRLLDLPLVDNPAYPYFVQIVRVIMLFEQGLEVDRINQRSLAIGDAVYLYGLFDKRKRRTRA
jgi:hypothetical protein